jgi:signal transduction histidine kinase
LEVIMSSVDNLERYHDRLGPDKREQLLRTINKSVRRMAGMMEDVLVLGRVEAGKMEFKPALFDLRAFCHRIVDELQSATNQRCPVQLKMDGVGPPAYGDENVLRHILGNLLANAIKYSPENEPVTLDAAANGTHAVFRVSDRGCGIPPADRDRLFQAFHRGSNVRHIPGTGLGLLIVKRCVDLHGGEISFESAEGKGTIFTVRLPLFLKPTANV